MKIKSNSIICCFLLLCYGSCHSQKHIAFAVNTNCNKCEECISVSKEIEKDNKFNKVLSSYIYNALIGGYDCNLLTEENLKELYVRPSFKKSIILFYTDSSLQDLSTYDDAREWAGRYKELLHGITDLGILHDIANELLSNNEFEGLQVLWAKANISKLSNLNQYLKNIDESNFFVCAELAAFFQVSNVPNKSNEYLLKAGKIKEFETEYNALLELLKSNDKFDYLTFQEAIFGGM